MTCSFDNSLNLGAGPLIPCLRQANEAWAPRSLSPSPIAFRCQWVHHGWRRDMTMTSFLQRGTTNLFRPTGQIPSCSWDSSWVRDMATLVLPFINLFLTTVVFSWPFSRPSSYALGLPSSIAVKPHNLPRLPRKNPKNAKENHLKNIQIQTQGSSIWPDDSATQKFFWELIVTNVYEKNILHKKNVWSSYVSTWGVLRTYSCDALLKTDWGTGFQS